MTEDSLHFILICGRKIEKSKRMWYNSKVQWRTFHLVVIKAQQKALSELKANE